MTDQNASELLTLHEAAVYLGVTTRTIRRWVDEDKLYAMRLAIGRQGLRFRRVDLDALIVDAKSIKTEKPPQLKKDTEP